MWQLDKHVARAMFDDRADLEVKKRGLPVPMPSPFDELNRAQAVPKGGPFRRWLAGLAYRWNLLCRGLSRLGLSSECDRIAAGSRSFAPHPRS